jgi:hypothetical protein
MDFNISEYKFLDVFLKNKKYIYITSITKEYCDFAHNWFLSLKQIQQDHLSLIVCLDKQSYDFLNNKTNCVLFDVDFNPESYSMVDWYKFERITKILGPLKISEKYNVDFITSDVDVFFYKNPFLKLQEELGDYDMVCTSDRRFDPFLYERESNILKTINWNRKKINSFGVTPQSKNGFYNGAFSYIKISNKKIKNKLKNFFCNFYPNSKIFDNFKKFETPEDICLQTIANKSYKNFDLNVKLLSCFEFVNGSVWKIPYLKEKIKDQCYMVHYNFCDGKDTMEIKQNKIKWMNENNHWLV